VPAEANTEEKKVFCATTLNGFGKGQVLHASKFFLKVKDRGFKKLF
tara:strand:+ start:497 stop:634 length:138 start_codon:yes stop_codon:yes gene_type:complete